MQCPICNKQRMVPVDLASDLTGLTCSACSGVWLDRTKYEAWRTKQSGDLPEETMSAQIGVADTRKTKICPQCAHLLLPYRVGHGLSFAIDYCGSCGGIWCDRGEWDALKAKNLHDNLHDIVSQHWQTAVRQASVQESIEQVYVRHLGPAVYAKALEVRAWLREQPQKSLILAYLSETKPENKDEHRHAI